MESLAEDIEPVSALRRPAALPRIAATITPLTIPMVRGSGAAPA